MSTPEEEAAAKIIDTAKQTAQDLIDQATAQAEALVMRAKQDLHESLADIINDALGKNPSRYVDVSRIPLICKSIVDTAEILRGLDKKFVSHDQFKPVKDDVKNIKGNITWVLRIVVGGVLVALLGLVIINK